MYAIIRKKLGKWIAEFNGELGIFNSHDEAVEFAYNGGAIEFQIIYSSSIQRTLKRSGVEVLILNKS